MIMLEDHRLKEIREERGLTQEALGKLIGATKTQISKIEKGNQELKLSWIIKLAKALAVEPWEIIASPDSATAGNFQPDTYKEIVTIIHEYNTANSIKSDPLKVTDLALTIYDNEKEKMASKGEDYSLSKEAIIDFMKLLNKLSA